MRCAPWLAPLAALGLLSTPALAWSSFEADLTTSAPLRASGGVSLAVGGGDPTILAHLAAFEDPTTVPLLAADRLHLRLVRYEHLPVSVPASAVFNRTRVQSDDDVHSAQLAISRLRNHPQLLVDPARAERGNAPLEASGADCTIERAVARHGLEFPAADNESHPAAATQRTPGPRVLAAECEAGLRLERHGPVAFYGMDLRLTSNERAETYRTGTFEEEVLPGSGMYVRVTQVLHAVSSGMSWNLTLEENPSLRIHAEGIYVVGDLSIPRADGWRQWGSDERDGSLEPVAAAGVFRVVAGRERSLGMAGTTWEGPPNAGRVPVPVDAAGGANLPLILAGAAACGAFSVGLLWLLFARLRPDRVLGHPRRRRILEFIERQPGVEAAAVARALAIPWSNAVHHLRVLDREGQVHIRRIRGRTALFTRDPGWRGHEEQWALLRRPALRALHDLLLRHPGLDQAALQRELGARQPQVSKLLARLQTTRLVETRRVGRRVAYHALPAPQPPGAG